MEWNNESRTVSAKILDVSDFGLVKLRNGKLQVLFPEEVKAILEHRHPIPKPPAIQTLLKKAKEWSARLRATPGLTQTALAKELDISRVRVTQILNLLRLTPEIQRYVLSLPPTTRIRGQISEPQLRRLSKIQDHNDQWQKFQGLIVYE